MNRNKLVDLFVSNLSNVIVHKVLEKAIDRPEIVGVYTKEVKNSLEIAKKYREKINPIDRVFSVHDFKDMREKLIRKAKSELNLRIARGYTNISRSLVDKFVDEFLKEFGVS